MEHEGCLMIRRAVWFYHCDDCWACSVYTGRGAESDTMPGLMETGAKWELEITSLEITTWRGYLHCCPTYLAHGQSESAESCEMQTSLTFIQTGKADNIKCCAFKNATHSDTHTHTQCAYRPQDITG